MSDAQATLDPDADPIPVPADETESDGHDDAVPESVQPTLTAETPKLGEIADHEPRDENGVPQVLVSKKTNSRSSYHRQDPYNPGETACWLSATWILKPKASISRTADPCPFCYPFGDDEEVSE